MSWKYRTNKQIENLVTEIKALRIAFDLIKPLPHIEENLKRESILNSSLYSAKIEGNTLTINEIDIGKNSKDRRKIEVNNLYSAYRLLENKNLPKKLTIKLIKKFHQIAMRNLSSQAGDFRQESWGIFNQAGMAVYLAPAHFKIPTLMKEYLKYLSILKYSTPEIAAIAQFAFEKIHPFADGNGRVGRLISAYILAQGNFKFRGLVAFEKAIDDQRNSYYQSLEPSLDATQFIDFFLSTLVNEAKKTLAKLGSIKEELPEDRLLPRRKEILNIIKDHPNCSFDFVKRRFLKVNPKTLHYDLKKIIDQKFVFKLGVSRGVVYKAQL